MRDSSTFKLLKAFRKTFNLIINSSNINWQKYHRYIRKTRIHLKFPLIMDLVRYLQTLSSKFKALVSMPTNHRPIPMP